MRSLVERQDEGSGLIRLVERETSVLDIIQLFKDKNVLER